MDTIRRRDFEDLFLVRTGPCVSLFMPLHPNEGRDGMQDAVRLGNLAGQVEEDLVGRGMRRPEANRLLAAWRALPADDEAWQRRGRGLAGFLAPGFARVFHTNAELDEAVFVDEQFHIRPLVPLLVENEQFFVLALSRKQARLFAGDAARLVEMPVPGMPQGIDAALNIDEDVRREQVRSDGQGSILATSKMELKLYLQQVAHAVDGRLRGESAPLVLAALAEIVPVWREVSTYRHLFNETIAGSPDRLAPHQLHAQVWPRIQTLLDERRELLRQRLHNSEATPRASFGLEHIVPAAIRGRIDTLFVDCSSPRWGRYDAEHDAVELHAERQPGDDDLVERATIETLRHRGNVFAALAPPGEPAETAEALLRY